MAFTTEVVHIHYRRPPLREDVFVQLLLERRSNCIVTFMPLTPLASPLIVEERIVLEDGAPAIWFTFPDAWHDIGRFHRTDGAFTGLYANAITPVRFLDALTWETTDLFLDYWRSATGNECVLDEDEFEEAVRLGWLSDENASRARTEMNRIAQSSAAGEWPPAIVGEWTIERARDATGLRST
ncbi:MAG: DUF402 domain-containing protein [Longimicrobiales bacterium]